MEQRDKKLVVLIEDEEILAHLIILELEKKGYEVQSTIDGAEGLELIRKLKPDLVLLDIMLPSLNGFEIMEALHKDKILPDLPVVIISNSGQPIELDRAKKLGVQTYLVKVNLGPKDVLAKVEEILGIPSIE